MWNYPIEALSLHECPEKEHITSTTIQPTIHGMKETMMHETHETLIHENNWEKRSKSMTFPHGMGGWNAMATAASKNKVNICLDNN